MNVLIVDDTYVNRLLIKELILSYDREIKISEACNGQVALNKIEGVDLIFMDIQMPVMGGIECMKFIRNELKLNLPIIAITAYDNYNNMIECDKNNFSMYVKKPVEADMIKTILNTYNNDR